MKNKNFLAASGMFAILMASVLMPGVKDTKSPVILAALIVCIELTLIHRVYKDIRPKSAADIAFIVFTLLLIWEVSTKHLDMTNPVLVPPPENVFYVFYSHGQMMLAGVFSSLELLIIGFAVSLFFGITLGLVIGWVQRLRDMWYPIVKVLAPIPSVIYTPYIVAIMPTFRSASAMVIILGLFFPTLLQMIGRVQSMDKRILNSAKAMAVSNTTMIFQVMLPYMVPGIIAGLRVSLSSSIMMLTLAEMMGATKGMGYFIKNYADFANYTNVIAGIILVGIVVTILNVFVSFLESKIVRWV